MGLATLSYTSTASFLNLPGIKVFSGQKRLLQSLGQTCCKQAGDFQLLGVPVSRAARGHVCPADAGMAMGTAALGYSSCAGDGSGEIAPFFV